MHLERNGRRHQSGGVSLLSGVSFPETNSCDRLASITFGRRVITQACRYSLIGGWLGAVPAASLTVLSPVIGEHVFLPIRRGLQRQWGTCGQAKPSLRYMLSNGPPVSYLERFLHHLRQYRVALSAFCRQWSATVQPVIIATCLQGNLVLIYPNVVVLCMYRLFVLLVHTNCRTLKKTTK